MKKQDNNNREANPAEIMMLTSALARTQYSVSMRENHPATSEHSKA